MKITNNLDRIMWERKIKSEELAQRSGVSGATIRMVRNNPQANMTKETMEKICSALGIALNELITVEQESRAPVVV